MADGWTISVVSYTPDATTAVLAENMFNDPPAAGNVFSITRVTALKGGASPGSFGGSYRLRAVGSSNVSYSTFDNWCGVIPGPLSSTDVFPGGSITGNVCWEVPTGDAATLVMFDADEYSADKWTYFALR